MLRGQTKLLSLQTKLLSLQTKLLRLQTKLLRLQTKLLRLQTKLLRRQTKLLRLQTKLRRQSLGYGLDAKAKATCSSHGHLGADSSPAASQSVSKLHTIAVSIITDQLREVAYPSVTHFLSASGHTLWVGSEGSWRRSRIILRERERIMGWGFGGPRE